MRNPVRKFVGVFVIGVLGALFALPMLVAGAQTVPGEGDVPPTAPDCTILSVTPNPVPAFPATVTVTGVVESGVTVTVYGQTPPGTGPVVPLGSQLVGDDATFSIQVNVTAATDITVNFTFGNENAYTGGCATPGGEVVVRVDVAAAEVTKPAPAAQALAFTGSSDTPSYVLIGIAAIVLGAVLVVAARRRSQVS